jgi:hypothetical protein
LQHFNELKTRCQQFETEKTKKVSRFEIDYAGETTDNQSNPLFRLATFVDRLLYFATFRPRALTAVSGDLRDSKGRFECGVVRVSVGEAAYRAA